MEYTKKPLFWKGFFSVYGFSGDGVIVGVGISAGSSREAGGVSSGGGAIATDSGGTSTEGEGVTSTTSTDGTRIVGSSPWGGVTPDISEGGRTSPDQTVVSVVGAIGEVGETGGVVSEEASVVTGVSGGSIVWTGGGLSLDIVRASLTTRAIHE
jgi:hypothetical protein